MRDDPLVLGVKPAGKWQDAMRRHGMTLEELEELSSGDALGPYLGVLRGTHEIVVKPQSINTHFLVPTAIIEFPAIRNQITEKALGIKDSFAEYFSLDVPLPDREGRTKKARFRGHQLGENMTFAEMVKNAGGLEAVREKHLITQWQIRRAVEAQPKGGDGPLQTNGNANFFFIRMADGSVAVVSIYWSADYGYWAVWVRLLSHLHRWSREFRLFLRTENLVVV